MPRNDYADAYSDPGQSMAGDSDAPNLTWEWWNEMTDGGARGDAFIADPGNDCNQAHLHGADTRARVPVAQGVRTVVKVERPSSPAAAPA